MSKLPSFNFLLKEAKQKANGEAPLYLRIIFNRRAAEYATGITIAPKDWNATKQQIKPKHPTAKALNAKLEDLLHEAKQIAIKLDEAVTAKKIKEAIKGDPVKKSDFFTYMEAFTQQIKEDGHYVEYKHYRVTTRKLRDYHKSPVLAMAEIDTAFLEGFKRYLFNKVGNSTNTVQKEMQRLRRVVRKAIKENILDNDPFLRFDTVKKVKTSKTHLSWPQIQAIEHLKLEPSAPITVTRDAFMFSFYCAGIRFGDICSLKQKNIIDGRLKYQMSKSGKYKSIKLLKPALEIVERYWIQEDPEAFLFPILNPNRDYTDPFFLKQQISSRNVMANKHLKRIAAGAGIQENVSYHVSRHSFADYARAKGMNTYDISKALGHSDLKTTEVYLKGFDEASLDQSMSKLFEG